MYSNNKNNLPLLYIRVPLLAAFAALFEPHLLAVAFAPLAFIAYYGAIAATIATTYHLSRLLYSFRSKVVLQSNASDYIQDIEEKLWKTKHIPLSNLVGTFISAKSTQAKAAALLGIWQLYTTNPPSKQVKDGFIRFMPLYSDAIIHAEKVMCKLTNKESTPVPQADDEVDSIIPIVQEIFEADEEVVTSLENNKKWWTIAAACTALVVTILPPTVTWALGDKKNFANSIVDLGKTITAKNIIWNEVKNVKENILWGLWKVCGQDFIPEDAKAALQIQKLSIALMKDMREYEVLINSDFFGVMRSNRLSDIERGIAKADKLFMDLSSSQKSQYNLLTIMQEIKAGYDDLLTKRMDLITHVSGKQEPVVVQISGLAGHGKSEFMKSIIKKLEDAYGITAFYRNTADEYWSHFGGQQILVWDDIGFKKEGTDYAEFCHHAAGAPSSAVGAAIKEKGRPTNPRFIFLTSNVPYLGAQGHNLTTPDAFHRRRDFLINLRNEKAAQWAQEKGTTIPIHEFDPSKSTFTLLRSVPITTSSSELDNAVGTTTEQRLFTAICELEKARSNRFKAALRLKNYYSGRIPEDETIDEWLYSQEFLTGKSRPVVAALNPEAPEFTFGDFMDESPVNTQAVNPETIHVNLKHPVFIYSGPSGTGKTHAADTLAQRITNRQCVKASVDEVYEDIKGYFGRNVASVVFVDDITLDSEGYRKFVKIANHFYEHGGCQALIATENSHKLRSMDQQCVAEIHRRSHVVTLGYNWKWTQFFWSWADLSVHHKEHLASSANKPQVMRDNIWIRFKEYSSPTLEKGNATDTVAMCTRFVNKTYGDEVKTTDVWTLPMPSEIDFTVSLSKSFLECANLKSTEIVKSLFTGGLYTVRNISGRFTPMSALQMLRDILEQAPCFAVPTLDQMVVAFNDAHVESTFKPPGVAVLATPEGAVALCWRGKVIKMFKVTSDPVELLGNGIDVHRYFNSNVESHFKDLTSTLVFTEESIAKTEETVNTIQQQAFTATNVFCQILECALSLLSIAVQIWAPLALANEVSDTLNDRAQLRYLNNVKKAATLSVSQPRSTRNEPIVVCEENVMSLFEFNKYFLMGHYDNCFNEIVINNPQLTSYFNHMTYVPSMYKDLRECVLAVEEIPSYPTIAESNMEVPTRRKSTIDVYGGPGYSNKLGPGSNGVVPEKFSNKRDYDAWVARMREVKMYSDDQDRHAYERQLYDAADDFDSRHSTYAATGAYGRGNANDWSEESAPVPKTKLIRKPHKIESAPEPKKIIKNKVVCDSAPVPRKPLHISKVTIEAAVNWFDNTTDDIKCAIGQEIRSGDHRYAFMSHDGWHTCNGPDSVIRDAMRSKCISDGLTWAVMVIRSGASSKDVDAQLSFVLNEGPSQYFHGDILRIKRSLGKSYWHYGIVGPHPSRKGDSALYHVQSADRNGVFTSYIATDELSALENGWEKYAPDTLVKNADGTMKRLHRYQYYGHLLDHAGKAFAYNVDHANCETWVLSMAYGIDSDQIQRQQLPAGFMSFIETFMTFKSPKDRFAEFREIEQTVVKEGCVDPSGLLVARNTLPPSQVIIRDVITDKEIVRGLGVAGKLVLTVGHISQNIVKVQRFINGNVHYYQAHLAYKDIHKDLALYEIDDATCPSFRDITRQFMNCDELKRALAMGSDSVAMLNVLVAAKNSGQIVTYACRVKGQIDESFKGTTGKYGIEYQSRLVGATTDSAFTQAGDCGSPLVILNSQVAHKIIGIHRAASERVMYASFVDTDWLVDTVSTLKASKIIDNESYMDRAGITINQCVEEDLDTGFPLVGYSMYSAAQHRGTKLRKTPIDLQTIKSDCEPAILSPKDDRAPGYRPELTTLAKFDREQVHLDIAEFEETADEVAEFLIAKLAGKSLKVFTEIEAINGPDKAIYPLSGSIDRNTSAGFPQTQRDSVTKKGAYLDRVHVNSDEVWKIAQTPIGREMRLDIDQMHSSAALGHRPTVVFSYFPKDEVLKRAKIDTPNTRGILAGNMAYVINFRRYFLALHYRCQEIFSMIPIKIGINPRSSDWHDLAAYHLAKGELGFDADAKNWDASLNVDLMRLCPRVCNQIYKALDKNWKPIDDVIRSSLHEAVEKPYVLYQRKVVQLPGGQVSGQPGTAFENSLINWIICAVIYKRTMREKNLYHLATFNAFMRETALSVYGDDMMITLSRDVVNDFDLTDYIKHAATMGIEITPADKTSDRVSHLRLSEMSFLKRAFTKIGAQYVGPIELKSIAKAIKWMHGPGSYIPKKDPAGNIQWKTMEASTTMAENFENQLFEAALHGKEVFSALKAEINEELLRLGMDAVTLSYKDALIENGVLQ